MRPPSGPHPVGVHDARLPDAAGGHRVRIFYPAASDSAGNGTPRWLPASSSLVDETALGLMRFIRAPAAPLLALLTTPLTRTRMAHARADARPAAPPVGARGWPLALFSHGLGGSLAAYTLLCMDAASHGRVVAAVEHHDGSAVAAFKGAAREEIPYRRYDAAADGSEWEFRNRMLNTRLDDLDAMLAAVRAAAAPGGAPLEPLTPATQSASPQQAVEWTGLIDFDDVQVVGHSFGGATAVGWALRHGGAPWLRRVLALDAWLFALDKRVICDREKCKLPADLPILFIDCDFSFLKQSRETRGKIAGGCIEAVTGVGSVHNNTSDFAIVVPRVISYAAGMTPKNSDPEALLGAQSEAACAFLNGTWTSLKSELESAGCNGIVRGLSLREPGGGEPVPDV